MRHVDALLSMLVWVQASPSAIAVDYVRDVKPILSKNCYNCHGPLRQKSGLRLDHLAFIRQGGDSGPAIASKSDDSRLLQAVSGSDDIERMPLEAKPLSDEQIATLKAWIDEGAQAPEEKLPDDPRQHWSFQKPTRPPLPEVKNSSWAAHPIDRFLAAEHGARNLTPTAPAPKNVLLRRAYLDLIGLSPTTAELRTFMADHSDEAYERVVDQLLASPQYGERWGRHWMDVWRYSDWDGFGAEVRESKPHIWRWRDWIIESLNADKPYDGMIREMLAADEIAPGNPVALRASGFLVRNWYRFNRNVWMEETVEHTSKAFLGITLNCARCHDHMYDPILQTEYYQFRALFEPYDVRTDRVPGQSDTDKDGLVRAYDAKAAEPTYLFVRGNEAKPDKEHPVSPGVPKILGAGELKFDPVALAPNEYYPGLRGFVQAEALSHAQADVDCCQTALAKVGVPLTEARKALADFVTKKLAAKSTGETAPTGDDPQQKTLHLAVKDAQLAAATAEQEMLAASAELVYVKAQIAADNATFATPPAANAKELARDAARAERVFKVERARRDLARLERDLATMKASASDDKLFKKVEEIEKKQAAAMQARDAAQLALGEASETYTRFADIYPATSTGRRTALARWIASKDNPLTARVAINHIWLRHFGSPLVPTVFDFGQGGKRPTHPALLDWLAVELMEQGWKMKAIHRLLVTSTAYRMQSSSADEANRTRDPENVYLWRMNPRRMEAEVVRDSTLRVSGELDPTMFGPDLDPDLGMTVPRRSIYFRSSKEKKVPFLAMFDSPNVTDCYRRSETVVPQQALAMVNSSLTLAESRRLAGELAGELGTQASDESLSQFIAGAFERILCREPSGEERRACLEFLARQSGRLADPKALVAFASGGENPVKPAADPGQRARENLVHVLLNHNDFLTIR